MGSKYSKSNNEELNNQNKISNKYHTKEEYIYETENLSYNIYTKANTGVSSTITAQEISEHNISKDNLVDVTFQWDEGGTNVSLAGTFSNWEEKIIPMIKNEKTRIFEYKMKLPRMKHYFKFIVDGRWACSRLYKSERDNRNIENNCIDLTKINNDEISLKNEDYQEKEKQDKNIIIMEGNSKSLKKTKKLYDNKIPQESELNTTAPAIIPHYHPTFNINYQSKQDLLENKNNKNNNKSFLKYKEKNFHNENNTFKKILIWPHEKLMHLCQNIEDLGNMKDNYLKISTTIRLKHKYLTLVYYRPK